MPVSYLTNSVAEMLASALNTLTGGSFSHLTMSEDEMLARVVTEMTGQSYSHLTTSRETLWELLLTQATTDGITFNRLTQSNEQIAEIIANNVSGGGEEYEGPLDIDAAAIEAAYGLRALSAAQRGQALFTLVRESDSASLGFSSDAVTGEPDVAAITAWIGGSVAHVSVINDQSGNGRHLYFLSADWKWTLNVIGGKPGIVCASNATGYASTDEAATKATFNLNGQITAITLAQGEMSWYGEVGGLDYWDMALNVAGLTDLDMYEDATGNETGGIVDNITALHIFDAAWEFGNKSFKYDNTNAPFTEDWDGGGAPGPFAPTIEVRNAIADTKILELLLYSAIKSSGVRLSLDQNIATYYGITLS